MLTDSEASLPLREALNALQRIVDGIYQKRDHIVRRLRGKHCVSTSYAKILINTLVCQIVDDNDVKPELSSLERALDSDAHKGMRDELERERRLNRELLSRVKDVENSLQLEARQKNDFRALYEECLKSQMKTELKCEQQLKALKAELECKTKEIEHFKAHTYPVKIAGNNEDLVLKQLCLMTKPLVMLERPDSDHTDANHLVHNLQAITNENRLQSIDVDMRSLSPTPSTSLSNRNEDNFANDCQLVKEIKIQDYYREIKTRSGLKYNCDWSHCSFQTASVGSINTHVYTHKRKHPYYCDHGSCRKAFLSTTLLLNHKRLHKSPLKHSTDESNVSANADNNSYKLSHLFDVNNDGEHESLSADQTRHHYLANGFKKVKTEENF